MKAVLDACVLFPTVLREILIGAAEAGLYTPVWSDRLLEEWRRAAARQGEDVARIAGVEIALLTAAWPQARVHGNDATLAGLALPDRADAHVIATALAAGADLIVTANLPDFPARVLAPLGLRAGHPDAFLRDLWSRAPATIAQVAAANHARAQAAGGDIPLRALLKRAGLPRLARAMTVAVNANVR